MKELISTFYDLTLLDSEQAVPKREQLNLSNLLIDFLTDHAPLFDSQNICPDILLPDSSVFIYSDRNMIERILQNLLTNAVCYSLGTVRIQLTQEADGKAVICFQNTVQNAADFDAGRMFDRFYTGDKSRHNESTGLGLAVVKTLAEKLDGQVSAAVEADLLHYKSGFVGRSFSCPACSPYRFITLNTGSGTYFETSCPYPFSSFTMDEESATLSALK